MRDRVTIIGLAAIFVLGEAVFAPQASAQRSRSGASRIGARTMRIQAPGRRVNVTARGGLSSRTGRAAGFRAPGRSGVGRGGGIGRALGGLGGGGLGGGGLGRGRGLGVLGNALRNAPRYGYGRQDRYNDEYADAYRDVGIANAVVNLVGIMVSARQQCRPQRPAGHYQRQRVLVKGGYYEQYQVWIPPVYDRHTGEKVGGGYHETRTRWVPDVYEEREVWVPGR